MNTSDGELLRRYSIEQNDSAFEQLVQRHIDLVYSAALRQVNGDAQLAEDVAQSVFTDLARKASKLAHHTSLLGWLYTSTRFAASSVRRQEQRRRVREQQAYAMNSILTGSDPEPDWQEIRPLLDDAMHSLGADDREAVLLRHFERRSFAEIGECLRLSENAARMKVDRALQKLQDALEKRGVTSATIALATLVTANAVGAAPASLAATVSRSALAGAAATGASLLVVKLLALVKTPIGIAALAIATTAIVFFASTRGHSTGTSTIQSAVATTVSPSLSNATPTVRQETSDGRVVSTSVTPPGQSVLHLTLLTKQTGEPVPSGTIESHGWIGGRFRKQMFTTDRVGNCDVTYPTNVTKLDLMTHIDGLADTRLLWKTSEGDVVPRDYVLKLDPGVPIGGQVVDPDGNPVPSAKVSWYHRELPGEEKRPESHEFNFIEVTAGDQGRWQLDRIAADMMRGLSASAKESNFVDSAWASVDRDNQVEQQFRDKTYVFHLGRPVIARGVVVDPSGKTIAGANVFVGPVLGPGRRDGTSASDGTFSINGCEPGKRPVSADAPGFGAITVECELGENSDPIRLTLQPAKTVRFQVVDGQGKPIPKAYIWYDPNLRVNPTSGVQTEVQLRTDDDGRAAWTNAPTGKFEFAVSATGFARRDKVTISTSDEEHVITLKPAVTVSGQVRDESTGQLVPKFHIVEGYPQWNPANNSTNAEWSDLERYHHSFSDGAYSLTLSDPVVLTTSNGWCLRFTADGYAPFPSRVIQPDETEVQLDVRLRRAKAVPVTVYNADGQLAIGVDVGLVHSNSRLTLTTSGFSRRNGRTSGTLLTTDENGQFELPPDDSITRVIVASPEGYAEATPSGMSTDKVMHMQPWGNLDVTCVAAGKPVVGRDYIVELGGGSFQTVAFETGRARVKTDDQGHFSFDKVPPGKHKLTRIYPGKVNGHDGYSYGDKVDFEIRPGETTQLNPGASEHTVSATWQWAPGAKVVPLPRVVADLRSANGPEIPSRLRNDTAAMIAYINTPEFRAAQDKVRSYTATVRDGTLLVEAVQPGKYELTISAFEAGKSTYLSPLTSLPVDSRTVARAVVAIEIPADDAGADFNAGNLELRPMP